MLKNHIKLLTEEERLYLNKKYFFVLDDLKNGLWVGLENYNRYTFHPFDKSFSINCLKGIKRKITISVEAMEIWKKLLVETNEEYRLIDIEQAINILHVSYQPITEKSVIEILKNFKKI